MYYYYYYYLEQTKEVKINIKFEAEKGQPLSLLEFNEFLSNINELNRIVVFLTQPEYIKTKDLNELDDIALLNYHDLEIKSIRRENPFFLDLIIHLHSDHIHLYWIIWKIIISICKKYGKTTKDINYTLRTILFEFETVFPEIKDCLIEHSTNDYSKDDKKNLFNKIQSRLAKFLKNKKAQVVYNSFCTTTITITEILSAYEKLNKEIEEINLLDNNSNKYLF